VRVQSTAADHNFLDIANLTSTTPQRPPDLIVIGASARAACFSAARAGFSPYWLDQFGDSDLRAEFPGALVSPGAYPAGLVAALEQAPDAPVIYTGALENHPRVLRQIAARRLLLGNSAAVCARVRTPALLRERLAVHGMGLPKFLTGGADAPAAGRWLLKPERSGGGLGISVVSPGTRATPGHYLQEFIPGDNFSGVFVARKAGVQLLGITQQLVGAAEFHAPAFSYCGSIGPVSPTPRVQSRWEEVGRVLAREFGLRGLFGIDAVVRDDEVTVIEVNPRYTASVEVLEEALGVAAIALHMSAWGQVLHSSTATLPCLNARPDPKCVHGKACLFAPVDLIFNDVACERSDAIADISFADVPAPGTRIPRGAPILSVLCRADTWAACAGLLRRMAAGVYEALGKSGSGRPL